MATHKITQNMMPFIGTGPEAGIRDISKGEKQNEKGVVPLV